MSNTFTRPPSDWSHLLDEHILALEKPTCHWHYNHGELIFSRGQRIPGPTVLLSGAAYFYLEDPTRPRGEELVQLRWGGEILLVTLLPGTWLESLRALGKAVVAVTPFEAFDQMMQSEPALGRRMLLATVNQVLRDHQRMDLYRGLVVDRMATVLQHLAAYTGTRMDGGYLLDYPLRLADLATIVRAHPVECSRALTSLRERGMVEKRPRFRFFLRGLEVVQPQRSAAEMTFIDNLW